MVLNFTSNLFTTDADPGLRKKEQFASVAGVNFLPETSSTTFSKNFGTTKYIQSDSDNQDFNAPIQIPEGATITGGVVRGNAGAESQTYSMQRVKSDGTGNSMLTGSVNTKAVMNAEQQTTALVENNIFAYFFRVNEIDTGDRLYHAIVFYTI